MGERQLKYLDMLQSAISRMAANQFTCRAWSITLGTAVIGYAVAKDSKPQSALLAVLPAACFWIMDAYYLALEHAFRDLFKAAIEAGDSVASFNFDAKPTFTSWLGSCFSLATIAVHLCVITLAVIVGRSLWLK